MACPSGTVLLILMSMILILINITLLPGCLNGGAQIRAEAPMTAKEVLKNVESIYEQQQIMHSPEQNPAIVKIYNEFLGGHPYSEQARRLLHTQYHRVAKLEITNPLAIQW